MQLNVKTILNLKEKNPHFVYRDVRLTETKGQRIEVKVEPRRGSKGICSGCGKKCAGYDRLPQREFIHVPLWGMALFSVGRNVNFEPRSSARVARIRRNNYG